jgi:hypothetical protein
VKVHLKELKKQLKKKQKLKSQQRKTIKEGLKIEILLERGVNGNEGWQERQKSLEESTISEEDPSKEEDYSFRSQII